MTSPGEKSPADTGRYEIDEPIGRGGMATVYRGWDDASKMDVALKVLHPHLVDDEAVVETFEREASLMRRIDHPNVVRVFETTEIDGRPAIAMEYCGGGDLSEHRLCDGDADERDVLDAFVPILDALSEVHEQGVVHRDIKPHNVVFDGDDPKLIDFGIGQAEELMAADDAGQLGTVEYMAPERIDGLAVDARADIYSAGIMLFEMLCGHPPYRADTASAVMRMHRTADIPDPRLFDDGISDRTAEVVMKAIAKHPEQRFDRIDQMRAALVGDADLPEHLPAHSGWQRVKQRYAERHALSAPVESTGAESVVYIPPDVEVDSSKALGAIDRLVIDHSDYATESEHQLRTRATRLDEAQSADESEQSDSSSTPERPSQHHRSPVSQKPTNDRDFSSVTPSTMSGAAEPPRTSLEIEPIDIELLPGRSDEKRSVSNRGIARGLTQRGARQLQQRLDDAGVMTRVARRPRRKRDESRLWKLFAARGSIDIGLFVLFWVPVAYVVFNAEHGVATFAPATFTASLVVICLILGFLVGCIGIWKGFREWWLARMSTSYLLDFCQSRSAEKAGRFVDRRHFELLESISSPRIANSYDRVIDLALHLQDSFDDRVDDAVERIIDAASDLAEQIISLETQVAAVRPGELATQIRRLDRRIAEADHAEQTQRLMDEKADLRRRLTERDAAQQRLQSRAQKLHEFTSRLEDLARRHGADDAETSSADPDRLRDAIDEAVVFEFDEPVESTSRSEVTASG